MKSTVILWGLLFVCIAAVGALFLAGFFEEEKEETKTENQTEPSVVLQYGTTTLALGEEGVFESVTIMPVALVHDSRCPIDVNCIQAGTIEVKIQIVSGLGTSTPTLAAGDYVTTEAEKVTFISASLPPAAGTSIAPEEYRFTFEVVPRSIEAQEPVVMPPQAQAPTPSKTCYVGGCSSQICSDTPGAVSTCEYRESYACYASATCEVQPDGECGWTQTAQLQACVANAQQTENNFFPQ